MSKICTGPEFTGPLWALVRGHISQFALIRVRQYMITLDLSGDTTLKPCTTTFKRAWGLPCPHLVQRLMRERQPLEIEDFDMHWRLDHDTLPTINWSDIAQPPERITQRGRQDRSSRRFPSEFERVDNALRRPAFPAVRRQHSQAPIQSQTTKERSQPGRGRGGRTGRASRVTGGRLQAGESVLRF